MAQQKKYNPYDDVAGIVNMKSRYNQGKATGDTHLSGGKRQKRQIRS